MHRESNENSVVEKTRELCQAILADPNMGSIRKRIDTFMTDETARGQYESVVAKGQALNDKQSQALPISSEEITDFESHRDALLKNPVAKNFLDAREELHDIQHSIQKYVSRTLELGRLPAVEDLQESSCGRGCGCHGH